MANTFKTMDGNAAATYVAYALSEVATVFPITPSSTMGEIAESWSSAEKKNIFNQTLLLREMQSEAGAAGAMHGALLGGTLTTTFTASQGLLLMMPNMYKMAGELLPGVFHVAARALASHALSIFGDHQDVMAVRQTGFAFLSSASVQEAMDMAVIAHASALDSSVPFCHFFDGFRTSHEINKIRAISYEDMASFIDVEKLNEFRRRSLNPEHPRQYGTAQNPDIYFQTRESSNPFYDAIPNIVINNMKKLEKITGRRYRLFDYYGSPTANNIIISMGSSCGAIEETVDYLNARGEEVGLVKVHLFRPFSVKHLLEVIPTTVKTITVLDRTKEPGSIGDPLYLDIVAAYKSNNLEARILAGRYGLASKEFTPQIVASIFRNMKALSPKNHFTVGIEDDVTFRSLDMIEEDNISVTAESTIECKLIGLGSDGTVGANKQAIKIIGDNTNLYAQGYFQYDSKKSGGFTISHLRFSKEEIRSTYLVNAADYIACHKAAYVTQLEILDGIKEGGIFVLNSPWQTVKDLERELPGHMRRTIAQKKIKLYNIDAFTIAMKLGLGSRINMIMQTVFFQLTNVIPIEEALKHLKDSVKATYGKKGDEIVAMNISAIDEALPNLQEIKYPKSWNTAEDTINNDLFEPEYIANLVRPINDQKGDSLPVSAFDPDGSMDMGTTAFEKRKVAIMIPEWIEENCIQCNQCAFICPHATIRPFLATADELQGAPESFTTLDAMGKELADLKYRIQVYPEDCVGCSVCVDICPGKKDNKALVMKPVDSIVDVEKANLDFAENNISYKGGLTKRESVKGSQFYQPLLEFSAACPGCGETSYVKLLTQLCGEDMIIANATGCSSIWGGSSPSVPYTQNEEGHGPAWANSLFEDGAEFGYGIMIAYLQRRKALAEQVEIALRLDISAPLREALSNWLEHKNDRVLSKEYGKKITELLTDAPAPYPALLEIYYNADLLSKKILWIVGGDGWAYDIGYGGVDHVLASGEDINIIVLDTEVYSNTGGQASKSTPLGAISKFASKGKRVGKKDLGRLAMTYGYVYVASTSAAAKPKQLVTALDEAINYDGPSLILAYAPCIEHGIKKGLSQMATQEQLVVDAGYWPLYRYNPSSMKEGKNPLTIEYKGVNRDLLREVWLKEARYNAISKIDPDAMDGLYKELVWDLEYRYTQLQALANASFPVCE
ncbi:MAG: pyruvate:ferredoxin (flavodoxin) oxidoreductase [Desulfovibrionaceae bacterium]